MPDKTNHCVFEKCNSCARTSDGPGLGPLSTVSHPQVCCLFKVARQEHFSGLFLNEVSRKRHDGLCEDCPNVEFHVNPIYGQPPTSEDPSPEGCEAASEETGSRKRKKIEPRKRDGFKKLTLEWRPPKFKRKIWFGTYSYDEIHRARDAVNYYLKLGYPYFLADSRWIFAAKPLTGIKFQDLLPSCNQFVDEALVKTDLMGITSQDFLPPGHRAAKTLAACVVYGRQVKNVIHSVLGKQKKSAEKKNKCNVQASQKLDIYDAIAPLPSFPEDDEELSAFFRCTQSPNYQWGAGPFPLDEMFSLPVFPNPNHGESSTTEEGDFFEALWELFPYG